MYARNCMYAAMAINAWLLILSLSWADVTVRNIAVKKFATDFS